MLGDYVKTTWVSGGAPGLSAPRMNNIENKTEELDTQTALKASQVDLNITNINVATKASQVDLDATNTNVVANTSAVANHLIDATAHTKSQVELSNVDNIKQLPIAGGTMTGVLVGQANTSYTTAQMRNVILSTGDAVLGSMGNGVIWIKYV